MSNTKKFLPNAVVLGAAKCGTTWLSENLKDHPDILIPRKEIHYFTENFSKGIVWYSNYYKHTYNGQKILMDVATNYFFDYDYYGLFFNFYRNIAKEIYKTLKTPKLIVLVRDPVERAFSNYINLLQGALRRGAIYSGNIKTIDSIKTRKLRFKYPKHWSSGFKSQYRHVFYYVPDTFEKTLLSHPYLLTRGFYAIYVKKYLEYFNKNQFLFLEFNLIKNNPKGLLNSVYDFLGIKKHCNEELLYKKINPASRRKIVRNWKLESYITRLLRNKTIPSIPKLPLIGLSKLNQILGKKIPPKMREETAKILARFYRPHNLELEKITGLDLSHWK